MKTVGILLFLLGGIYLSYGQTQQEQMLIHFDPNEDQIGLFEMRKLDQLLAKLPEEGQVEVMINGHTDATGSNRYNQKLSERRVAAVKNYLFTKKPSLKLIEANGFSEHRPIKTNHTDEGRAANRRVEIIARFIDSKPKVEVADLKPPQPKSSKVYRFLAGKGSEFYIPETAFGKDIDIDLMEITIKESFSLYEMMLGDMHLQSSVEKFIESAGIFCMDATLDGQRIETDGKQAIRFRIPTLGSRDLNPERFQLYRLNPSGGWQLYGPSMELIVADGFFMGEIYQTGCYNIANTISQEEEEAEKWEVKVRGKANTDVFLLHSEKNAFAKLKAGNPMIHHYDYEDKCCGLVPTIVAFQKRDDKTLFVEMPLSLLKYKKRKNQYIIRKRDFKPFDI